MRNGSIDYLRFLGAIGIIWFHLHLPGFEIGLAALPMFVAFFVYFGAGRSLVALNRRLLYPWLVWSAIFAVAKVAQAVIGGNSILPEFEWWMLLAGPSIHLWFLPFSYLFVALVNQVPQKLWVYVVIILVPISVWLSALSLPQPCAQWVTVIPAACMGLVLNYCGVASKRAHIIGWTSVGVAVLAVLLGSDGIAVQYAIGIAAVLLALSFQTQSTPFGRMLSETSFGVYLIHPLVFALVLYLPVGGIAVQAAVVILVSLLLTRVLQRIAPALF